VVGPNKGAAQSLPQPGISIKKAARSVAYSPGVVPPRQVFSHFELTSLIKPVGGAVAAVQILFPGYGPALIWVGLQWPSLCSNGQGSTWEAGLVTRFLDSNLIQDGSSKISIDLRHPGAVILLIQLFARILEPIYGMVFRIQPMIDLEMQ